MENLISPNLSIQKVIDFLHIFETVVDCNIICEKGAIWLFLPHKEKRNNTKIHMKEMREKRKIAEKYKREKERKSVEKS